MAKSVLGPVISAAAGLLVVLVGQAVVRWVHDRYTQRRAARFLAIRVVCALDRFTDDCAAAACERGREDSERPLSERSDTPGAVRHLRNGRYLIRQFANAAEHAARC